jgi:hypothetical protein
MQSFFFIIRLPRLAMSSIIDTLNLNYVYGQFPFLSLTFTPQSMSLPCRPYYQSSSASLSKGWDSNGLIPSDANLHQHKSAIHFLQVELLLQ